jgi:hypothetical protein
LFKGKSEKGVGDTMEGMMEFLRQYWLQIGLIIGSLVIGGNLAQQFTVLRSKSLAGRLARFTLAVLFSVAYYLLFFYLSVVFRR